MYKNKTKQYYIISSRRRQRAGDESDVQNEKRNVITARSYYTTARTCAHPQFAGRSAAVAVSPVARAESSRGRSIYRPGGGGERPTFCIGDDDDDNGGDTENAVAADRGCFQGRPRFSGIARYNPDVAHATRLVESECHDDKRRRPKEEIDVKPEVFRIFAAKPCYTKAQLMIPRRR